MLNALYQIGKYQREKSNKNKYEHLLSLSDLSSCEKIIAIVFELKDENTVDFVDVHSEDYSREKGTKMLYRSGSSRGGDHAPTSRVTRLYTSMEEKENESSNDSLARMFEYGWFKKYSDKSDLTESIKKTYDQNEKRIREKIGEVYGGMDSDVRSNLVMTVKLIEDGEEKWVEDFKVFKKALEDIIVEKEWIQKYQVDSKGDGVCSLCDSKGEVYGFVFPFAFFTVNPTGFAPDLKQERTHQRLPICKECGFTLSCGKNYLADNEFGFDVYFSDRLQYYPIIEGHGEISDYPSVQKVFEYVESAKENVENMKEDEEGKEGGSNFPLLTTEDYVTDIAIQESDKPITMHYLFFTQQQSQQRIQKYINDIPPTYLKQIKECINKVKESYLYRNSDQILSDGFEMKYSKHGWLNSLVIQILPDTDEISDFSLSGFNYAMRILTEDMFREEELFSLFMKEMRRLFRNDSGERRYALSTFFFYNFLNELNLLRCDNMKEQTQTFWNEHDVPAEEFFDEYGEAFSTPERRAAFIEGVVTGLFLMIQAKQRGGSTPFRKKLGGLQLDERKLQQIFTDLENKYAQYDAELAHKDLRDFASHCLLEAEENGWNIRRDELSYFFSLGMNLSGIFKSKKEGDDEDEG